MSRRDYSERDIHLALDGEMLEDERPGYELWLETRPDMKARHLRFEDDGRHLSYALRSVLDEPVPERLSALLDSANAVRRRSRRWREAAAAALFVLGVAGGYGLGASDVASPHAAIDRLAGNAIAAHKMFAAEKRHVVEVAANEEEHLVGWLSKRVGVELLAPDLTSQGFSLVGGRLLPDAERAAAQFMYEDAAGARVSLYIVKEALGADAGLREVEEKGAKALVWRDGGYGCVVAGDLGPERLAAVGNDIYRQISREGNG